MSDSRYQEVCLRFLLFTTPTYIVFFLVLWFVRYLNYDNFSNTVFIVSIAHMVIAQLSYVSIVKLKKPVLKSDLFIMLWSMVLSNIVLFSYWIVWLDNTRMMLYMLAPMSSVALFSIASLRQAVRFNILQTLCFYAALFFSVIRSNPENVLYSAGLDLIYITVLFIMCIWLSSIAATHAHLKFERDAIVQRLRGMTTAALESDVVDASANKLTESSQQSSLIAATQQQAAEQLATTVEELSANSQQNAEQARKTLIALKKTENQVSDSHDDITQLVQSIDSVRDSGEQIKSINAVIDDIAYQTNLLSLNAMIEASRSGDEGSGFKVVALEVRKLAERAADAAKDINNLLDHNRQSIEKGVMLSAQTLASFETIKQDILPLANAMQSVADASHEQSYSIEQLSGIAHEIEGSSQSMQKLAADTKITATELKHSSQTLSEMIAQLEQKKN